MDGWCGGLEMGMEGTDGAFDVVVWVHVFASFLCFVLFSSFFVGRGG